MASSASSKTAGIIAPTAELAQDITGYDEHRRRFALLIAGGVAAILIGVAVTVYADDVLGVSDGWPNAFFLLLCAPAIFSFVYCGIRYSLLDITSYNKEGEADRKERAGEQDFYAKLTGSVCGIIMLIATLIGLCLLFLNSAALRGDWSAAGSSMFWLAWPIGGVLCGIAATAIQLFKNYRER